MRYSKCHRIYLNGNITSLKLYCCVFVGTLSIVFCADNILKHYDFAKRFNATTKTDPLPLKRLRGGRNLNLFVYQYQPSITTHVESVALIERSKA